MRTKSFPLLFCAALLLIPGARQASATTPVYIPITGFANARANVPSDPTAALVSDGLGFFWSTSGSGGTLGFGTVYKVNIATGALTTVVNFAQTTTGTNRGGDPSSAVVGDGQGNLWGSTQYGGSKGAGTLFRINAASGALTTVTNFTSSASGTNRGGNPTAALVSDGSGNLWGTTTFGGAGGYGTVFKINTSNNAMATVVDFTGLTTGSNRGGVPSAALVSDGSGNFWSTTYTGGVDANGTLFKINQSTNALVTAVDFAGVTTGSNRGANPTAGLVSDGSGNFWGSTTAGGANHAGTLFEINQGAGTLATTVDFTTATTGSNRGAYPFATLVSDGSGNLWGSTTAGGANGDGTLFEMNPGSRALATVIDFAGTGAAANLGATPYAALVSDGSGNLWGSTSGGGFYPYGANGPGTVFKINAAGGTLSTVVDFTGDATGVQGASAWCALVTDTAGNLWGTTEVGGAGAGGMVYTGGLGTIFITNPATGVVTTVASFSGNGGPNRGNFPVGTLLSDGSGNFWGATSTGGTNGAGTVFKVNAVSGAVTTLVQFTGSTSGSNRGGYPYAGLVADGSGNFWGTTIGGGGYGYGTVFKINPGNNALATVADFAGTTTGTNRGSDPSAALVADGSGNFWGTTLTGGSNSGGTVFEINQTTYAMATLFDFPSTTGTTNVGQSGSSYGALVSDGAGNFWGTTQAGGFYGYGTVFKINQSSDALTVVLNFNGLTSGSNRGGNPYAALASDGMSNLWGSTTTGGTNGYGTFFEVNTTTGAFSTALDLTGTTGSVPGADPQGALLPTQDGFYGITSGGGIASNGQPGFGEIFLMNLGPATESISAGSITPGGALLTGTADPEGFATSVYIQYGTDTTYGTQTGSTVLGSGTSPVSFSDPLSGLSGGTTYDYQLVFVTTDGTFYGPNETFTTATAPVPAMPPWGTPILAIAILALARWALIRRVRPSSRPPSLE